MRVISLPRKAALWVVLALVLSGCQGCPSVTLKTLELQPTATPATGSSGTAGSTGWCLSAGNPPPTTFSAAAGQAMVGFDNFFRAGAGPFSCDDLRAVVFRGGVRFDVSQFDQIVTAQLLFDTDNSVVRTSGTLLGTSPPTSHATALGLASAPFTSKMQYDTEAPLTPGPGNINVGVLSQVQSWIDKSHPNFGFVIAGPTGLVDTANPPKNNDAKVSWYSNFRLRITYNPAQNLRAPQ